MDVEKVIEAVHQIPAPWTPYPGGYPDEIESALIDAVYSIRAKYGSPSTGVRAVVQRYREAVGDPAPDHLDRLASMDSDALQEIFRNAQTVSGGATKAEAIRAAARNLVAAGVHRAADLDPSEHIRAYTRVKGLGKVTWQYFHMLLGHPGVKADTWVTRWVAQALGEDGVAPERAAELLRQAADQLDPPVTATDLDHAIWAYARRAEGRQAAERRRSGH